jgi:hypothetical protein
MPWPPWCAPALSPMTGGLHCRTVSKPADVEAAAVVPGGVEGAPVLGVDRHGMSTWCHCDVCETLGAEAKGPPPLLGNSEVWNVAVCEVWCWFCVCSSCTAALSANAAGSAGTLSGVCNCQLCLCVSYCDCIILNSICAQHSVPCRCCCALMLASCLSKHRFADRQL